MKQPGWLRKLRIARVALVDRGANPDADIVLVKRDVSKAFASMEECMAEHDDAEKCKALMGEMEKMVNDHTDVEKRLADFEKRAADAEAKATAAEVKAKAAEDEVRKLADQREIEVYITKAAGLTDAGFTPDDAAILRKLYKAITADEAKRLDAVLNGAAQLARDSAAWREVGITSAGGFAGSAYEKMEKLADALVQKDAKLTQAQAMIKVMETPEGKRLYDEYETERREAARRVR